MLAGIAEGEGTFISQAGNININATEVVNIDNSFIANTLERGAIGEGGNLNLVTGSIFITNGGVLTTSTAGVGDAGDININALDTVSFRGVGSNEFPSSAIASVGTIFPQLLTGRGNSGNININTRVLSILDGAFLSTSTAGVGNAGNVTINAINQVVFDGKNSNGRPTGIVSTVGTIFPQRLEATGHGGDILINTESFFALNGSGLSSSTTGIGDAGNITINARDTVVFDEVATDGFPSTASSTVGVIFPQVIPGQGNGGDINIITRKLKVTNGAYLAASSILGEGEAGNININADDTVVFDGVSRYGSPSAVISTLGQGIKGKAGSININASSLFVTNGAVVGTFTVGQGEAGDIWINASRSVELFGLNFEKISNGFSSNPTLIESLIAIFGFNPVGIAGGLYTSTEREAQGEGGDITVKTPTLRLTDGAIINAQTLNAGQGGNITLSVKDLLLLERNSRISTRAGTPGAGGNGGNIDIDAKFIVAFPNQNSDIIANASEGRGGNINITTQGIFNIKERKATDENSTNDIDASSQFGLQGTVEIDATDTDPSRRVVNLPTVPVEAEIVQACQPGNSQNQSKFVITGRGGLPPSAQEALGTDTTGINWVTLKPNAAAEPESTSANSRSSDRDRIVEAQGWVVATNGKIVLTAQTPTVTPQIPWLPNNSCKAS